MKKSKILLMGKTGLGKTYITECVANAFLEKGNSVCFVSAFEMTNCFLKYHSPLEKDKYSWIAPFIESDVLIIDDLGTEPKFKNVTLEYLYLVISEREKYSRPIIVSTNLELGNILDTYGERIYSRLVNKQTSATFKIQGDDLRVSK
jgi:DNA replication protein DnaC